MDLVSRIHTYFFPIRYFRRILVRDILNEPDDDIVSIYDYGYQEYPIPYTRLSFYTRKIGPHNIIETLYAHDGDKDNVPREFIEKIVKICKSKTHIRIGELKDMTGQWNRLENNSIF
jgi:hypothetical protein